MKYIKKMLVHKGTRLKFYKVMALPDVYKRQDTLHVSCKQAVSS